MEEEASLCKNDICGFKYQNFYITFLLIMAPHKGKYYMWNNNNITIEINILTGNLGEGIEVLDVLNNGKIIFIA